MAPMTATVSWPLARRAGGGGGGSGSHAVISGLILGMWRRRRVATSLEGTTTLAASCIRAALLARSLAASIGRWKAWPHSVVQAAQALASASPQKLPAPVVNDR